MLRETRKGGNLKQMSSERNEELYEEIFIWITRRCIVPEEVPQRIFLRF